MAGASSAYTGDLIVSIQRALRVFRLAGSPLTPKDLLAVITTRRPESFILYMTSLCVRNYRLVKSVLRFVVLGDRERRPEEYP